MSFFNKRNLELIARIILGYTNIVSSLVLIFVERIFLCDLNVFDYV